jgi:hypothetical protein
MQRRDERPVLHLQQYLDQPRDACRQLEMPDVAFHRAEAAVAGIRLLSSLVT